MTLFEDDADETYTVSSLTTAIGAALRGAFPRPVWVRGEIRDLTRARSGHVYFTLSEAGSSDRPGGTITASIRVMLSARNKPAVNRTLKDAGAGRLDEGTQVRIEGRLDFYAARGQTQLLMSGVDAAYTLGQLAAERAAVIRTLTDEGLMERNAALAFPLVPLRIGLVTSHGSDAERDVVTELQASGFGFSVWCWDARVQGADAPASVASGIATLSGDVDVIVVARGGGGRSDLQAFDSERVARSIALCATPVITGIGHERDHSIADEIAHLSFKTPTAVAQHLVACVREVHGRAEHAWATIATLAETALGHRRQHVDDVGRSIELASRAATASQRARLEHLRLRVCSAATRTIEAAGASNQRITDAIARDARRHVRHATARLESHTTELRLLDPATIHARGWSITRDEAGRVVRSLADVVDGDELSTTLIDGAVMSRVTGTVPRT